MGSPLVMSKHNYGRLLLLIVACARCAGLQPSGDVVVEYCVSSRWGVSCFFPGPVRQLRGIVHREVPLPVVLAGRTAVVGATAYMVRVIFNELREMDGDNLIRVHHLEAALRLKATAV